MMEKNSKENKLQEPIRKAMEAMGISMLNQMQNEVLNADKERDLLLLSPTGSGKTLAFLLPLLPQLKREEKVQVLIIAPSRELAMQIETVFRSFRSGFKATCCYGGHSFLVEKQSLSQAPVVWIGTPGRILDHIQKGSVALDAVNTVIFDEFDKSLELKFVAEMKKIIIRLPNVRRRVLTSATSAIEIPAFVGLKNSLQISYLTASEKTLRGLNLYQVKSPETDKLETLYRLLGELNGMSTFVFCNYRESAERVSAFLKRKKVDNVCFHGGLEQTERELCVARLRNLSATIFVTTDLAARGLDIPEVRNIVHYHLPIHEEAFVHRNGRTARMNATGTAFLLLNSADNLPEYIQPEPEIFWLPKQGRVPKKSEWGSLKINRGKRDKISKTDVVGFLTQKGMLKREDIGRVDVFDSCALAAVKLTEMETLLDRINSEKIKKKTAKCEICK